MILLTFNVLNSTAPLKNGAHLSSDERSQITVQNTKSILRNLENHDVRSTFFIEIDFAERNLDLIKIINSKGHEIALYQENSSLTEIEAVKKKIEDYFEKAVRGIRQKETPILLDELKKLEFNYFSNIENANILFPFKRLIRDTTITEINGLSVVPESISPYSQLPYNDFVFQTVPIRYYQGMVAETLKNEEFVLIYLNSLQFTDLEEYKFKIPFYRRYNSGKKMEDKLDAFLTWINKNEHATSRMKDYIF